MILYLPNSLMSVPQSALELLLHHRRNGYTSIEVALADIMLMNITGTIPGPLNIQYYIPITASNTSTIGAGSGAVFVTLSDDTSFIAAKASVPINLTTQEKTVLWLGPALRCHHLTLLVAAVVAQ
ncbi:hypothetical protein EDB92DRAFT_1896902 [Lactarius akahatsu]|uniref:Uncharacterized protein n=1 Tax=Lactarius akahatsu TaxID=416441 RepID=A0AAD4Q8U6_9AGAM|nr:hypothetical protein EDB92DRAFT_1896902 [Lactarius akahatsu]